MAASVSFEPCATAVSPMTHIAVQEHVNGKVVDWLEQSSDEQYRAPADASSSDAPGD